jgi:hypothetical protein
MSGPGNQFDWVEYAEEDWFSGYAVQARYPGNQPTPDEAKEALEIARIIRRFARTFLGLKNR